MKLKRIFWRSVYYLRAGAAILGTKFNLFDLVSIGDWFESDVVSALDHALNLHMIKYDYSVNGGYSFNHDNIAQTFYDSMNESDVSKIHGNIGLYLEKKNESVMQQ